MTVADHLLLCEYVIGHAVVLSTTSSLHRSLPL
jgi:hypothetical protein